MRLWTAMLGAWLAAGSSAVAEGAVSAVRVDKGAALDCPPAAERPADGASAHAPDAAAAPARKA